MKLLAEWFWTDRWMGSSAFLLPLEPRGLYREMLTQAWRRGARLPSEPEAIRRAVGCTEKEWDRCWPVIERFWRRDGNTLVNDTQQEVWRETKALQDRASDRGRHGGKASALARAYGVTPVGPGFNSSSTQVEPESNSSSTQVQPERKPPSPSPSPSPDLSPDLSPDVHTHAREVQPSDNPTLSQRAGDFIDRYRLLYPRLRKGAHYIGKPNLDFGEALQLVSVYDDNRLDRIATYFLSSTDAFCRGASGTMAQLRSKASWCDTQLREKNL